MSIPVFDAHCDTLSRLIRTPSETLVKNSGQWSVERCKAFGPQAQVFALYWDSKAPFSGMMINRQLKTFQKECRRNEKYIAHCTTGAQARKATKEGKVAAFLSVEGAELIGCSLEKLEKFYNAGVRIVNPTWNHANALSGSHCEESDRGLSELGKEYVKKMQKLGMLVDVSHISDQGFWDIIEITKKPVIASHSNSRNVFFHSRNLTDEQFTAIMKFHGVVGLNAYARFLGNDPVTANDLMAHLEHFLSLGGEKTVALGGDWDGCDVLPEGYTGVWSWADFYETLLRSNYSEDLVKDLFFNNLMRTVNRVCTM